MGIIRVPLSPMIRGGVGSFSYYVRNRQQEVRQRRNNSNYGDMATRSAVQQSRRVRWTNVINTYKACLPWIRRGFDEAGNFTNSYAAFVSQNIPLSQYPLSKGAAAAGACVPDGFMVTKGRLLPLNVVRNSEDLSAVLRLRGENLITTAMKEGEFWSVLNAQGYDFRDGDGLSIAVMYYRFFDLPGLPSYDNACGVITRYYEKVVNLTGSSSVGYIPVLKNFVALNTAPTNFTDLSFTADSIDSYDRAGLAMIHTRKGRKLQVSTQRFVIDDPSFFEFFEDEGYKNYCEESYGTTEEVILTPGTN